MTISRFPILLLLILVLPYSYVSQAAAVPADEIAYFDVKAGSHPHDVAATPVADGAGIGEGERPRPGQRDGVSAWL